MTKHPGEPRPTAAGLTAQEEKEPNAPKTLLGNVWAKLAVSLLIAVAFALVLKRGGLPLWPSREALASVDRGSCVAYFVLLIGWYFLRAARWRHLLRPLVPDISLARVVSVSCIGYGAILVLPLRAGEFVRPYLIQIKERLTMATAMGTIGAERIIDGLMLTALLGFCLQISSPLSPLPDHIGNLNIPVVAVPLYSYLALTGFTCAFLLMGLFHLRPTLGKMIVEGTVGLVSNRAAARASEIVTRLSDGLRFLPRMRYVGPFLLESLVYWGLNALSIMVLARGCGLHGFSFTQAVVVMGVLGIGIVVPAGPGLFGAFQASTYAGLAMFYGDEVVLGPGAAFVFLLYAFQSGWHVVAALFFLATSRLKSRHAIPVS